MSDDDRSAAASAPAAAPTIRQPRGIYLLFTVEMWERFSFYGMRAILVLFIADSARGGMGWSHATASRLFGLYGFFAYALPVVGGYIADRFWGTHRSMMVGAVVIAAGHFCHGGADHADVLPGIGAGGDRDRLLQGQRLDDGRPALPSRRPAPRRRLHHLLHGRQRRRALRSDRLRLPRREPALGLALRLRRRRRRDAVRPRLLPEAQAALSGRHRRPAATRRRGGTRGVRSADARGARPDGGAAGHHGLHHSVLARLRAGRLVDELLRRAAHRSDGPRVPGSRLLVPVGEPGRADRRQPALRGALDRSRPAPARAEHADQDGGGAGPPRRSGSCSWWRARGEATAARW